MVEWHRHLHHGLLIFLLLAITAVAAPQEQLRQCSLNSPCRLNELVLNNSWQPYITPGCNITIILPSGITELWQTPIGDNDIGFYEYNYTPSAEGLHMAYMNCSFQAGLYQAMKSLNFIALNKSATDIMISNHSNILKNISQLPTGGDNSDVLAALEALNATNKNTANSNTTAILDDAQTKYTAIIANERGTDNAELETDASSRYNILDIRTASLLTGMDRNRTHIEQNITYNVSQAPFGGAGSCDLTTTNIGISSNSTAIQSYVAIECLNGTELNESHGKGLYNLSIELINQYINQSHGIGCYNGSTGLCAFIPLVIEYGDELLLSGGIFIILMFLVMIKKKKKKDLTEKEYGIQLDEELNQFG